MGKSVVVVGAGAAGIKLAHTLATDTNKAIDKVTILEANDYFGGRVKHFDFEGHVVERGANWISGRESAFDNPIYKLAKDVKVKKMNQSTNTTTTTKGINNADDNETMMLMGHKSERDNPDKMIVLDCGGGGDGGKKIVTSEYLKQVERFDEIYGKALEERKKEEEIKQEDAAKITTKNGEEGEEDISVRAIMEKFGWTAKNELNDLERAAEHNVLEVWVVDALEQLSGEYDMRPGANDVELGQDEIFIEDSRGLNSIFHNMIDDLKKTIGIEMCLETEVSSICYDESGCNKTKVVAKDLKTSETKEYNADIVVCTTSIGVLQSDAIRFVPPLPEWKATAINQMKMFNFAKVYAKFDKPVCPYDKDYIVFVTHGEKNRGHYPLWMRYKNTTTTTIGNDGQMMMCYLGGAQARRVENTPTEQLKDEIHELFASSGIVANKDDCRPSAVAVTDWSKNPRFLGSYSYYPLGAFSSVPFEDLQKPVGGSNRGNDNTLYFAGEAFDDKYNGWIQGGYMSGERVAKSILSSI